MSEQARRASASLKFNGQDVQIQLNDKFESITYKDVASGESDSVELIVENKDQKWMRAWKPVFGDTISGTMDFYHWYNAKTPKQTISLGNLVVDSLQFKGSDSTAKIGALAVPYNSGWRLTVRTKTWEKVTLEQIGQQIASRYGLQFVYDAPTISIASVEQSQETDSAFLYKTAKDYSISMKVFQGKIILYDRGRWEAKAAQATIDAADFENDGAWTLDDTIQGIYTGGRASYKAGKKNEELSIYVGFVGENDAHARNLKITETCDSKEDAGRKVAAKVNDANAEATVISGSIYPNPALVSGLTVNVTGFGPKYNGKYFIDKMTMTITGSGGTTQDITMHKCQKLLTYPPQTAAAAAGTAQKKSTTDIAKDVIRGKYGNGQARKDALAKAGYDYATVQAEVNRLMRG